MDVAAALAQSRAALSPNMIASMSSPGLKNLSPSRERNPNFLFSAKVKTKASLERNQHLKHQRQ